MKSIFQQPAQSQPQQQKQQQTVQAQSVKVEGHSKAIESTPNKNVEVPKFIALANRKTFVPNKNVEVPKYDPTNFSGGGDDE